MTFARSRARHGKRTLTLPVVAVLLIEITGLSIMLTEATAVMQNASHAGLSAGAGEVALSWDSTGTSQLAVSAAPLTPGSSLQDVADLTNTGSEPLGALQLALAGSSAGTMSDGVMVALDRCSVAWSPAGAGYTCSGTSTSVSADRPLPGLVNLVGSPAVVIGGVDHLRLTIGLAASSPAVAQGKGATLTFIAEGVQGVATQR